MKLKQLVSYFLIFAIFLSLIPSVSAQQSVVRGVTITSDASFFSKLNLNASGLSAVQTAVNAGNYTTAKEELLAYYKNAFSTYSVESNGGISEQREFQAMNDVVSFSEEYINGVDVTATSFTKYSIDLHNNLQGVYILDQIEKISRGIHIASSESSMPPQLEIYDASGKLLITLTATEDKTVRPTVTNIPGDASQILAKHWPDTTKQKPYSSGTMRAYIRFDVTKIPSDAKTAKLVVYAHLGDGAQEDSSSRLCVFQSYCVDWTEDTLTWQSLLDSSAVGHYSYDGLSGGFDWQKADGTPSDWLNYNTRFYEIRGLVERAVTDESLKDAYLAKAKELLLDFIADINVANGWPEERCIESSNRTIEFSYIYKYLLAEDLLTADENIKILSWLYDETTFLYNGAGILFNGVTASAKHNVVYSNIGLWHLTGFYSAIAYFSEFTEATAWRNVYNARLSVVMDALIHEDGSYNEVTFGYITPVIKWCATLKEIMTAFNDTSDQAKIFSEKMILLTRYYIDCALPSGELPYWGQGAPGSARSSTRVTLESLGAEESNLPIVQNLRNYLDSATGIPMETASQYDGIKVVTDRTHWGSSASMLFMNAKCAGNHSHRDALSLLLYYQGRSLLTDTGTTSYDLNHPHYHFQNSATRSHNTIEIDGTSQTWQ